MLKPLQLILTFFLVLCPSLRAQEDGPYVLWSGQVARVFRVQAGLVQEERHRGPFELAPGLTLAPGPREAPQDEFDAPERIFALSDIHGQLHAARVLLEAHGVVTAQGRWSFGRGHLVVVGDTMDRGPEVTEAYWFLRTLEDQARAAGGRVHVLLGNHELMVLSGDYRYVNPKYLHTPEGLPPLATLYGPDSEIGRWLRTRPTLLRLGAFLFVHGGLSPAFTAEGLNLSGTNQRIREGLRSGSPKGILAETDGPFWYRGLLPGFAKASTDQEIDRVLRLLKVRSLIVGHTTLDRIRSFHGGRVYAIDVGLQTGKGGEAWLWQGGRAQRALPDGRLEAIQEP